MEAAPVLESLEHAGAVRDVGQQPQLQLAVIRHDEGAAGLGDEGVSCELRYTRYRGELQGCGAIQGLNDSVAVK